MNIKINCDNKKEMNEVVELLNSKFNFSDIKVLESNEFTFLDSKYFVEVNNSPPKSKKTWTGLPFYKVSV